MPGSLKDLGTGTPPQGAGQGLDPKVTNMSFLTCPGVLPFIPSLLFPIPIPILIHLTCIYRTPTLE